MDFSKSIKRDLEKKELTPKEWGELLDITKTSIMQDKKTKQETNPQPLNKLTDIFDFKPGSIKEHREKATANHGILAASKIQHSKPGHFYSKRLTMLRIEKKMTRAELASTIGVDMATVKSYELGFNKPNGEMIEKIAIAFGVSKDYLLGQTTEAKFSIKPGDYQEYRQETIALANAILDSMMACNQKFSTKKRQNLANMMQELTQTVLTIQEEKEL